MGILGPRFRKDAGAIVESPQGRRPAVEAQTASGRITVTVNGERLNSNLKQSKSERSNFRLSRGRCSGYKGAVVVIVR